METGRNSFIKNSKIDTNNLDPYLKSCFLIQNKKTILKKLSYLNTYPYFLQDKSKLYCSLSFAMSFMFLLKIMNPRGVALRMHLNKYTNFRLRNNIYGTLGLGFFIGGLYGLDRLLIKKNPYSDGMMN